MLRIRCSFRFTDRGAQPTAAATSSTECPSIRNSATRRSSGSASAPSNRSHSSATSAATAGESGVFEELVARDPDPAVAAEVAEECDRLLAALADPELRRVALLRMDGHSVEEVAAEVGCAPRSVKRKLHLIRTIWEREAGHEPR